MIQKIPTGFSLRTTKAYMIFMIILTALIVSLLGGIYLRVAWNEYHRTAKTEALQLAKSIEALLHAEHVDELVSGESPEMSLDKLLVEQSLFQLVKATDSIYYAYILKYQNENIVVVADSAGAETETIQAMRRSCESTADINRLPFETGQSVLSEPVSSSCGVWIRALVPIQDTASKDIAAVLGLSYSAAEWRASLWKRMTPDAIIVACLIILILMLFILFNKHFTLKKTAADLKIQEALYRNIFEQAPIGIFFQNGLDKQAAAAAKYINVNPMGEAILGRTADDLKNLTWLDLTHEKDLEAELPLFERFTKGEISSYAIEKRLTKPDGSTVWVNYKLADLSGSPLYGSMYLCLIEDISERKQSEESLQESERSKSVFFAHIPGMAYRCLNDNVWTMEFVSEGCYELTGYNPESLIGSRDITYKDIISPEYRDVVHEERKKALLKHRHYNHEYEIITKSGHRKWVLARGRGLYDAEGNVEALEGIVLDISEQKKKELQIVYLREHDFLTGLYNRKHMEQEKKRLDRPEFWPLSVAICDIDGLRVINDAYSHEEGDQLIIKTARLIEGCLRGKYAFGHTGGGEFMLLLPNTDSRAAHQLKTDIKNTIENYNRSNESTLYAISVTIGHSTKEAAGQQIQDVIKSAEEYLNSRKLLNRNSSHSTIVSSIMATLYAKSQETEKHGQRLWRLCRMMGERLGLEQKDLDDLQLLSKLHDIGKIGIEDHILNKPGKLSDEEWKIMKQHPEIGYRIAMATPQLEHIADYILYHHERWDGMGYPMGLKGQDIPIVSRVLSISDAFDAMTEDRIYRKALSHEEAIEEIDKNAGTQFDPDIAKLFVALMSECQKTKSDRLLKS